MVKAKRAVAGRRTAAAKARTGWTVAKQAAFLAELARTCNVSHSAQSIGLSESGAYGARNRLPAFREAWAEALKAGYQTLEMKLLERAIASMETPAAADEGLTDEQRVKLEAATAKREAKEAQNQTQAIRLLSAHRETVTGGGGETGAKRARRSPRDILNAAVARHGGTRGE